MGFEAEITRFKVEIWDLDEYGIWMAKWVHFKGKTPYSKGKLLDFKGEIMGSKGKNMVSKEN